MTYEETLEYMYSQLPMYQKVGKTAFKKDLGNTLAFCEALGNPHTKFKSIHVGGTNGKGSSSHTIASILQEAGYKVGLYTSPHLKSFTERIRINGKPIPEQEVIRFVETQKGNIEKIAPSFFEMTVAMSFDYFAKEKVDFAVIEVGLGGRLDSTNIIQPEASLITNIGLDHVDMLGDTLPKIAFEKAGIIKANTPAVISESHAETRLVFEQSAKEKQAPIYFATDTYRSEWTASNTLHVFKGDTLFFKNINPALKGWSQRKNILGVVQLIEALNQKLSTPITLAQIKAGIENAVQNTGIKGRWQTLSNNPLTICDVGHNEDGITQILAQINSLTFKQLHIVFGVVNDKDLDKILGLLPKEASYYFCKPNVPRGLDAQILFDEAKKQGLNGQLISDVNQAIQTAQENADKDDLVFIGGSTFVVAEVEGL